MTPVVRLFPGNRLIIFSGLWLILAGWDPASWIIGAPSVLFATWLFSRLAPATGALRLWPMLDFLRFFLIESVRAGVQVARLILLPRPTIAPGFQTYRMRLVHPRAQLVFLNSISLLPGSLTADLAHETQIRLHALDASADHTPMMADLERRIGRIFGESLGTGGDAHA